MFEHIKYKMKLEKLFRQKESLCAAFCEDIRKARKDNQSKDDIASLEHQSYFEESMLDEEITILATDNLTNKATRRFIPIPAYDDDGMWERCKVVSSRYVLTNQGISQLRSSLRKEQKEQVELVVMTLAVLTGIVGAITGLVAVIMK